ncbi:hypothetical protein FYA67_11620 [Bordetella holmesii]|nr:hypothetical protein H558_17610 [Bordetella holmesii H558]AMD50456.1 hypothetical protein F783_000435 [Bordetella holmesii F627]AOB36054.1 hypothetical protein BBB42_11365 [Bordetella holmesii]AUL20025.1 hypothetical protein BTL46_11440 [Bordetella holmesii]AUL23362.1 hypothetical protein BTL48_11510 [Bordetella holmesii]
MAQREHISCFYLKSMKFDLDLYLSSRDLHATVACDKGKPVEATNTSAQAEPSPQLAALIHNSTLWLKHIN